MPDQQLLDYISQHLKKGTSPENIRATLHANGWQENDINEAFVVAAGQAVPSPSSSGASVSVATIGFSAAWGRAWSIYKSRFLVLIGIMAGPLLLSVGVSVITGLLTKSAVILLLVTMPIVILSQLWGQVALFHAVVKNDQEKIGIVEAYRLGWGRILSYLWVAILVGLITMGGTMLLIIPGIVFSIWYNFASFVLICEGTKGTDALLKSREYVRGNGTKIFLNYFCLGLVALILSAIVTAVLSPFKSTPVGQYVNSAIGLLLTPFIVAFSYAMYAGLRAAKGNVQAVGKKGGLIAWSIIGLLITLIMIVIMSIGALMAAKSLPLSGKQTSALTGNLAAQSPQMRDIQRNLDIVVLRAALETYHSANSSYPASLAELSPAFLPQVPADPQSKDPYQYERVGTADYRLCAQMEQEAEKCVTSKE